MIDIIIMTVHHLPQAAELLDGSVKMTVRHGGYSPTQCTSTDGGLTFSDCHVQTQLLSDDCQTSLLAVPHPANFTHHGLRETHTRPSLHRGEFSRTILISAHPNSQNKVTPLGRQNCTISVSHDDGETWHDTIQVNPGPSAYTALASIRYKNNMRAIACLYERSKDGPPVDFDTVAMAVINVESLF
eukprot:scpid58440/ scgid4740/ 